MPTEEILKKVYTGLTFRKTKFSPLQFYYEDWELGDFVYVCYNTDTTLSVK